MSGPIVRTGTTPKFWENWDRVFGKGDSTEEQGKKKAVKKAASAKSKASKKVKKKKKSKKS